MNSEQAAIFGSIATWIGALGTIGAFVVAFIQIHIERSARKERHAKETNLSEKEQALKISAWIEHDKLIISNSSHHPIHNFNIKFNDGNSLSKTTIPPGKTEVEAPANSKITLIEFTDNHLGLKWAREPGKPLHQVK